MLKNVWVRSAAILFGLSLLFVIFPIVYPEPLFAYKAEYKNLSIHADRPIPEAEGIRVLVEIKERLDASPIQVGDLSMKLFVANTSWRRNWLWIIAPSMAGGFVAVPGSGNSAFLSGADFMTNELIAPSGYRPHPPRTLVYYGAHELTHVAMAEIVDPVSFYRMPEWIREGIADYVGLPRENASSLYAKIGENEPDIDMMRTHGVYAPYRLLVTYFVDEAGWSIDQLLESELSLEEAQAIAFGALKGH